jgi:hypothetical protein
LTFGKGVAHSDNPNINISKLDEDILTTTSDAERGVLAAQLVLNRRFPAYSYMSIDSLSQVTISKGIRKAAWILRGLPRHSRVTISITIRGILRCSG